MAKQLTKQQYIEALTSIMEGNKNLPQDVADTIKYTIDTYNNNKRDITLGEIKDTVSFLEEETHKTLEEYMGLPVEEEQSEKKVENKQKPVIKKVEKQEQPKTENKKKEEAVVHEEIPHTSMLATFPKTLKSEQLKATLKLRNDLKDIKDVANAYNQAQDIVLAMYWTKRHLVQYADSYDPMGINPNKPTEFENDLDLVEITYANDLVVTGVSMYSYIPHTLLPKDFVVHADDMRYVNGCEFQVYEIVEIEE